MLVWSVGEVLWDVFPDQERFGGAPLNFCANIQRLGDHALLLSAVGDDERGRLALDRMRALGLDTEGIAVAAELPTGAAIVGTNAEGEPSFVIPRPAAFDALSLDETTFAKARTSHVDWLYFGTLLQTDEAMERGIAELAAQLTTARCFYDMNLRTGQWTLPLVQRLSHLASILKLNESEAQTLFGLTNGETTPFVLETFCRVWARTYGIDVICVTLGPDGCLVYQAADETFTRTPGYAVTVRDTVGSGDAFAAAFLHGYTQGWSALESSRFANALGALVASRAGATPDWTLAEVQAMSKPR
ncbi:fructokinase [Granulicella rosea]|uniref:Fructokinase n=1 Tax=Granulicella rosea TaxID=474952 RepID=A0A239DT27_9BACT|nr:carbohydrate kinase [Granulicella rosea]SNS35785.1 fructokinase [Granulicella rosea]